MKRIGIITILKVNNYGAELQAYATQAILKKLGYDAEIIDYLYYKNKGHKSTNKSRPLFRMGIKKRLAEWLYPIISELRANILFLRKKRAERFLSFHKNHTSLSQTFASINQLYSTEMNYDVYLAGSDQIWNPGTYSSLMPYFLDFAPAGKKRIAYASSFGVSNLPDNTKEVYRQSLSSFRHIGVREMSAIDILDDLGIKSTLVLDPTLLLDQSDWLKVAEPIKGLPEKYLLIYEITPSKAVLKIAINAAKKYNLKIVRICMGFSKRNASLIDIFDAGPAEFITLFNKASFVVTNSFHGTAFSVNFQKQFISVTPKRKNNNSRQRSLLNLLRLEDRLICDETESLPENSIDYAAVNRIITSERSKSIKFLTNAIDED